jgi:uncharacterized iron-regulated membrane protein
MPSIRAFLFQIHLWTGLVAGILFILLGLSGSALVYPQWLTAFDDAASPKTTSQGPALPFEQIIEAARRAEPESNRLPANLFLPQAANDAVRVQFDMRGGRGGSAQIYIDPITGNVLTIRPPARWNPVGFFHQLHENFLLPGSVGRPIVGWTGVGMLVLGCSGLVLWWPGKKRWKQGFTIQKGARGLRLYHDIHATAGIWFWIVFIFVTITGLPLSFPLLMSWVTGQPASQGPGFAQQLRITVPEGAERLPLATLIATAERETKAKATTLTVPTQQQQPVRIVLFGNDRPQIFAIDPYRGTRVGAAPQQANGWDRFAVEQLHGGAGLGPVWKFLVFLSGFLPLIFVTTGLLMWIRKRRLKARRSVASSLPQESS